ncbi:MAG: carboxypeptidase-like regulatory domain-containing protein, partial [Chloroflexota bacterium]
MNKPPLAMTLLLVCALLLSALGVGVGASDAPASDAPATEAFASFTIATPRAGIASPSQYHVDNLMVPATIDTAETLARVRPMQRWHVLSAYEAVFFRGVAGAATFKLTVYRQHDDGTRTLLGADQKVLIETGPRLRAGRLQVPVALPAPGTYRLALVARGEVRSLTGRAVVDEDERIVWVIVEGPTPLPEADTAAVRPTPTLPIEEALPVPTDRHLLVGQPRGHFVSQTAADVDSFDQGHGRVLYVRAGDSVTIQSAYEFVWFAGANGGAETTLRVFAAPYDDAALPVAEQAARASRNGAQRVAGVLSAVAPFPQAGTYEMVAVLYTRAQPDGQILDVIIEDRDMVRFKVVVIGQPEVGAIAGKVTDEASNAGLAGVVLHILQADTGRAVRMVRSDSDGAYAATALPAGRYLVYADPAGQGYLPEWFDNAPTRAEADPVTVVANAVAADINFALVKGGAISGTVAIEGSDDITPAADQVRPAPPAGMVVVAGPYAGSEPVAKAMVQRDGSYRLEGLPPGDYWVFAGDESRGLIGEYYDNQLRRAEADAVAVTAGQETADIDFLLGYGCSISGRVQVLPTTRAAWLPIKVTAYDWDSNAAVRMVRSDSDGAYAATALP